MKIYIVGAALALTVSFAIGFLQTKDQSQEMVKAADTSSVMEQGRQPASIAQPTIEKGVLAEGTISLTPSTKTISLNEMLDQMKNSKEAQRIDGIFKESKNKKLKEFLKTAVAPDGMEITPELQAYYQDQINELIQDKEEVVEMMDEGLPMLESEEDSSYRLAMFIILDKAITLHKKDPKLISIATYEITEQSLNPRPDPKEAKTEEELNEALSTSVVQSVSMLSHEIILANADPEQALKITVEAIAKNQDWGLKEQFYYSYLDKYPDSTGDMRTALNENNGEIMARIDSSEQEFTSDDLVKNDNDNNPESI